MNFRAQAEMLILFPKRQLATWRDLSMPRRDWSRYDIPACERIDARSVCAGRFGRERRQAAA